MPPSPIVSIFKKDWIVIDAISELKSVREHMDKNKFLKRLKATYRPLRSLPSPPRSASFV